MESKKLNFYDIYGFVIAVDAGMKKAFDLEYWRFRTSKPRKVDLFVIKTEKKGLPVRLRMDEIGIYMPFGEKENKVLYEPGVRPDWVLYSIEPLINWKDKCFLHCGAVEKDGKAILFPAEGGVGKTTMAMFLTNKGYNYLSDDWLVIGKDGKAYPFYKTVHVFDYNLKDKEIAKKVLGNRRLYVMMKIKTLNLFQSLFPHRFVKIFVDRFMPIFSIDIQKLHPNAKLGSISKIERIYWLKKDSKAKSAYIRKSNSKNLAEKMPYITALETNHIYKNYLEWVYSNKENKKIESKVEKDKEIMKSAFKNSEIFELFVPNKINPSEVYSIIKNHEK